jgi:DNA-binding CsgD family transcriptional regulator
MNQKAFVGRDAELAVLRGLVADVAMGRGGAVLVEGEPGIGKSSLVSIGLAEAQDLGCTTAWGVGDELTQRFPLRVMLDALEIESRSTDPRRADVAAALGGGWTTRTGARPGNPVATATERLLALVERLCAESPLVLVIDDIQWADEASLVAWQRLLQVAEQEPLLLVGVGGPVPRGEELQRVRQIVGRAGVVLTLGPLPEVDVVELVTTLVAAPDMHVRRLVEGASGNPLWIREVVDTLVREHAVEVDKGVMELVAAAAVPTSLAAAVARRLGFLSAGATEILRVAALLGPKFSVADLAVVRDREPLSLRAALHEATEAGVVEEAASGRLAFRHPLIQQALYDAIPGGVRSGLHRQAARALAEAGASVEMVAEQLLAGGDGTDEWMVSWLAQYARALVTRSMDIAAELLRRGVDHLSPSDPRWEALASRLADVLDMSDRRDEAEVLARRVLASARDPDRAAQMCDLIAGVMMRAGHVADGLATLAEGLRRPGLSDLWRARLLAQQAILNSAGHGNLDEAESLARRALALGDQVGDRYAIGTALHCLSMIHQFRGDIAEFLDVIGQALAAVGDDPDCVRVRLVLLHNRVRALHMFDLMADAEATLVEVRDVAERSGGGRTNPLHLLSADHDFWVGRWDDALAELEAVADSRTSDQVIWSLGVAAAIAVHRDDRSASEGALASAQDQPIATATDRSTCGCLVSARALAAERDGRLAEAAEIMSVVLDPDSVSVENRHRFFADVVRLALAAGDRSTAEAAGRVAEAEMARGPNPSKQAALARCRGLLDADPAPLLAAADHYRASSCTVELAQTLEDAAVLLAAADGADAARAAYTEATLLYADLGAVWDMRRCDARLRPYGIRRGARGPRRRPSRGWEALSPTEVTVARLVAQGRSNPDIAAELLLSRRTVQSHVSHILAKLGARSRVEIAHHVTERDG